MNSASQICFNKQAFGSRSGSRGEKVTKPTKCSKAVDSIATRKTMLAEATYEEKASSAGSYKFKSGVAPIDQAKAQIKKVTHQ